MTDAVSVAPRPAPRRRRVLSSVFLVITLLAVGGFAGLAWYGVDAARNVIGGTSAEVITDPQAPGFLAVVNETRVSLVVLIGADGQLDSTLLFPEPTDDGSASVVWTLGDLLVAGDDGEERTLAQIHANDPAEGDGGTDGTGGAAAVAEAMESVLGFRISDVTEATVEDIESIAAILAPVTVRNPSSVSVSDGSETTVRYRSGELELSASEVADFVTVRGAGEAPEDRGLRVKATLEALGAALSDLGLEDTGEDPRDLGAFLIRWSMADHSFVSLPVDPVAFEGSYLYRPNGLAIIDELSGLVPFPASAFAGQRPRARILNGTTDTDAASRVASQVAALGAEIATVGNAAAFDADATTVLYSDEAFAPVAERIAEFLGAEATRVEEVSDATDIDIELGADLAL